MPQVWEVHLTMFYDEISQLFCLLLIFVFEDSIFDYSDYCAERVEVDGIDRMLHERVDKLLGCLLAPTTLLLEEVR